MGAAVVWATTRNARNADGRVTLSYGGPREGVEAQAQADGAARGGEGRAETSVWDANKTREQAARGGVVRMTAAGEERDGWYY